MYSYVVLPFLTYVQSTDKVKLPSPPCLEFEFTNFWKHEIMGERIREPFKETAFRSNPGERNIGSNQFRGDGVCATSHIPVLSSAEFSR